jgi:hypothetical protein
MWAAAVNAFSQFKVAFTNETHSTRSKTSLKVPRLFSLECSASMQTGGFELTTDTVHSERMFSMSMLRSSFPKKMQKLSSNGHQENGHQTVMHGNDGAPGPHPRVAA